MTRHEADREDLFAEATALVRRAELACPGLAEPVVAGFRRDGGLSLYLGGEPAFHFDPQGRLKRAYRGGRLYRTQGETLAELTRERTPAVTLLSRRDLPPAECEAFVVEMCDLLKRVAGQIDRGEATVVRQSPAEDEGLLGQIASALHGPAEIGVQSATSLAPGYKGKR